ATHIPTGFRGLLFRYGHGYLFSSQKVGVFLGKYVEIARKKPDSGLKPLFLGLFVDRDQDGKGIGYLFILAILGLDIFETGLAGVGVERHAEMLGQQLAKIDLAVEDYLDIRILRSRLLFGEIRVAVENIDLMLDMCWQRLEGHHA